MRKQRERPKSASLIAGAPAKISDGLLERGRFAKRGEVITEGDKDGTSILVRRIEEELEEEEAWSLAHSGRPRLQIYSELFDEIIQKDKKFAPVLRKIKAVYTYHIQAHQSVELREISASHDDLVLEHGDLERRRRQLERDNEVLQQTIHFQNQQILQFEDIIARKDREIENLMRDNTNQMWQLPREIEQTLHKLRNDIEERSPANIPGYSTPATLEIDRLHQQLHEVEGELRITKLREKDIYSKYMQLNLQPPTIIIRFPESDRPDISEVAKEVVQEAKRPANPLVSITKMRGKSMGVVKTLPSRRRSPTSSSLD